MIWPNVAVTKLKLWLSTRMKHRVQKVRILFCKFNDPFLLVWMWKESELRQGHWHLPLAILPINSWNASVCICLKSKVNMWNGIPFEWMHSITQHTWAKLKIYGKRRFYPLISSIFHCRTTQVLSSLIIFIWIFLLCLPLVWTWQVRLLSCLRLVRVNVLLSCYGHMLWLHSLLHCGQPSTCGLSHNLYSSRFVLNNLVSFHGRTTARLYSINVILVQKGEVCISLLFWFFVGQEFPHFECDVYSLIILSIGMNHIGTLSQFLFLISKIFYI